MNITEDFQFSKEFEIFKTILAISNNLPKF